MWNFFPLNVATLPAKGLQEPAIWLELQTALNERRQAAGLGTVTLSGAAMGEIINVVITGGFPVGLALFQAQIEATVPYFVNHHDNGGNWQGVVFANLAPAWSFGSGIHNICAAAYANVGNGTNWTRKLGTAPGAVTTLYGQVTRGDYVAIFKEGVTLKIAEYLNEMYRVIDEMRWTKLFAGTIGPDKVTFANNATGKTAFGGDYDEAWANLNIAWTGIFDQQFVADKILRVSWFMGTGEAHGENERLYMTASPPTFVSRSVDFYGYGELLTGFPPLVWWDDNGLGYEETKWNLVGTTIETVDAMVYSALLGNDGSLQNRPSNGNAHFRGWSLQVATAGPVWWGIKNGIVKWDGPNGFSKIA